MLEEGGMKDLRQNGRAMVGEGKVARQRERKGLDGILDATLGRETE